jgi:hypothetical protein
MHRRRFEPSHPSTYSKRQHQRRRLDNWMRNFLSEVLLLTAAEQPVSVRAKSESVYARGMVAKSEVQCHDL